MNQNNHRGWRYLTIGTIVFFLGAGIWFFIVPIQKSKQLEQNLVDRFDWATRYTPSTDGIIQPDRLERFIRVRQAVQANCRIFQDIMDNVIRLENLESDPNLSASQKASEGLDSLKSMFSAAPTFLEFMDALQAANQGQDVSSLDLVVELKAEMAALVDGSHASPWPNGPPATTVASLASYQDRLSAFYCEGIARVETQQKNKGFNFEG